MRSQAHTPSIGRWLTKPIIPVVPQVVAEEAVLAHASLIFLQGCELSDLVPTLEWLKSGPRREIPVALHIDLLSGLSSDEAGLRFLAGLHRIDGIITVRPHLIASARRLGLATILLVFLQDSRAVERGLHIAEQSRPDAIELVPGVAAAELAREFDRIRVPRIAGGLVRTAELARQLMETGYDAVSTSNATLWQLNQSRSSFGKA
jgi:glycerol uptake operon antiterminator